MTRRTLLFLLSVTLVWSCSNPKQDEEVARLKEKNAELISNQDGRDSVVGHYVGTLLEIEDQLAQLKQKEQLLRLNSNDPEFRKTKAEQIVDDIELLGKQLQSQRERIYKMNEEMKESDVRIVQLERLSARMARKLNKKEQEVEELKLELKNLNDQMSFLFEEYDKRLLEKDTLKANLHTAYYAYGTFKELKEHQVLTKGGGFIGIGGAQKLKEDFNKDYFTQVDTRELMEVPLNAKKVKLITSHPSDSYEMTGGDKSVEKLKILDVEKFWSVSKYLVIQTEI